MRIFRFLALGWFAFLVISTAACGDQRGTVEILEAEAWDDGELMLIVPTCDGDPEVTRAEEDATEVRVAVVSGPSSQNDCQDSVRVQLKSKFGERVLIDTSTGDSVDVVDVRG